uniref:Ricin B-type lectin domain-containing protein n=1 Tax=Macrostomum lignano TaxID=282301 RepID=A0A1I8FEL1_9PLAT
PRPPTPQAPGVHAANIQNLDRRTRQLHLQGGNNHGSIQKWVYVADSACPPLYCLHNGSCSSYPGGIKFCKRGGVLKYLVLKPKL